MNCGASAGRWILYFPYDEVEYAKRVPKFSGAVIVVAPQFAGKRSLQRHQLVYATLGAAVGREIHALSIEAHTPEEWASLARGTGA